MHSAAASGDVDRIAAMQSYDAVNARNRFGWRPVHAAVYHGHIEALDALVAAGADVALPAFHAAHGQESRASWTTALHLAAARGDAAIAQRLLDAGAEPGRRDSSGKLAADIAREAGHRRLAALLTPESLQETGALPDYAAIFGPADAPSLLPPSWTQSGRRSVG